MKRLLALATVLLFCLSAHAQYGIGTRTGATAASGGGGSTNFGVTSQNTNLGNGNANFQLYSIFTTVTAETPTSCSVYVYAGTTSGKHIECGIYTSVVTDAHWVSTMVCHAAYTETGSESGFVTISLSGAGCGTLSATTTYFVFSNTDDSAISMGGYNCGSSCAGAFPSSTFAGQYAGVTYGTYPSNPILSSESPNQFSLYITATP